MKIRGFGASVNRDWENRCNVITFRTLAPITILEEYLSGMKDKPIDAEIKRHRERRSLDANAYAWVLIDRISEATGVYKEDIYREAIRSIGGGSETVCVQKAAAVKLCQGWVHNGIGWQTETVDSKIPGCVNVILYYGSSLYDSKQMSTLIHRLVDEAQELGIETATPEEIRRMEEQWGNEKASEALPATSLHG